MPNHWYHEHEENLLMGDLIADSVAAFIGSWRFIILQAGLMGVWVVGNAVVLIFHFDPYPFVFLNLFMSAEAAFSTPLIMMAQNRASDRDRVQAQADYDTNTKAKEEIEDMQVKLDALLAFHGVEVPRREVVLDYSYAE